MTDFLMPKLGADMATGTLVAWRKKPGDPIRRGDLMAEVDTDKGVIEIEAFADGVLDTYLVAPGASVPVGTALAKIRDQETTSATSSGVRLAERLPPSPSIQEVTAPGTELPTADASHDLSRLRISPSARHRARELGVDPEKVHGTGRGGAITREDIEQAANAKLLTPIAITTDSPKAAEPVDRQLRMRQAIAAAMSRANREIPHYYLTSTIVMRSALDWLNSHNETRPVADRLLYAVLLLKATALALKEVPDLNAFWQEDRLVVQPSIHLGIAISQRGGGLIAPALHDADKKSLGELMNEFRDLAARVRSGGLKSSELADPTITLTNLGERGAEAVYGVIYPPQVALVGFGRIIERPWCVNGQVIACPLMTATLAGDHRATDGHRGGLLLAAIDRLLQEPASL